MLWPRLYDIAHITLSMLLSLVLLRLSRRVLVSVFRSPLPHYALAALLTAGVGGGIEILQLLGHGDASMGDFVRDLLGSAAGLSFALSRAQYEQRPFHKSVVHKWALRAVAGVALGLAFVPIIRTFNLLSMRHRAFPLLCDFEAPWDREFVEAIGGAVLSVEEPPNAFTLAHGHSVAKVVFVPGSFSGLEFTDLPENWSSRSSLEFAVYSAEKAVVALELRVHGRAHQNRYSDRYNTTLQISPGATAVSIPLAEVRRGPVLRPLDMTQIRGVILFMADPPQQRALYFDDFRLR
jgi:hypothetical protein